MLLHRTNLDWTAAIQRRPNYGKRLIILNLMENYYKFIIKFTMNIINLYVWVQREWKYHSTVGSGLPLTEISNLTSSNSVHSTFSGFFRIFGISFLAASYKRKTSFRRLKKINSTASFTSLSSIENGSRNEITCSKSRMVRRSGTVLPSLFWITGR